MMIIKLILFPSVWGIKEAAMQGDKLVINWLITISLSRNPIATVYRLDDLLITLPYTAKLLRGFLALCESFTAIGFCVNGGSYGTTGKT